MASPIPFQIPALTGQESCRIAEALAHRHLHGDGRFTQACQDWFRRALDVPAALLTPSCTAALELAMLVAGIGPGDEVLIPDFTFVSTAQCVALRGAVPVFCDIRPDTLNIDETRLEEAITDRTRAIIVVHYAGIAVEMDAVTALARKHGLVVVEDAAQAIGCRYHGRALGGVGDMGAFSFHATKNVHCGEGGLLALGNPAFVDAAEIAREKGTNRRQFLEGRVDKYEWVSLGASYLPSEVTAAMLLAQLDGIDTILPPRRARWDQYHAAFAGLESAGHVRRPTVPDGCAHQGHIFYLLLNTPADRTALLQTLKAAGIQAPFHYVPLHASQGGQRYGRAGMALTYAADLPHRLIRLPLYTDLTEADAQRVIDAVHAHFGDTP